MTQIEPPVLPQLTQFRVEPQASGLVHLVFDCPDRSMNVFSNKAIHELGAFAEWLHGSDARGVVVRSGKASGFCAGADLTELGVAYDMIVAAPPADRFDIAFNHFFPLSHALRRLETAGKPVAAAIAGVALGGGCELALACHYRVVTSSPRAIIGLPECAVGLLPGGGGTQRMPRLVGVDLGLDVLLKGTNLDGTAAVAAGLADVVVEPGEDVAAAEAWLLSAAAHARQPWDAPDATPLAHASYASSLLRERTRELARMLGHEPAPLAILDCIEFGLMQPFDGAIRAEMSVFARLIQRPEPRNMIRTMFLGKQASDKARRSGDVAPQVQAAVDAASGLVREAAAISPILVSAGFLRGTDQSAPVQPAVAADYWFRSHSEAAAAMRTLAQPLAGIVASLSDDDRLQVDFKVCEAGVIPAYLGGVSGLIAALT
ncbi:enoyl-CoA hydratase-related protein [Novosphingobium lentum]|uniref:enoyl-CoA hydratase-related protein n=1 Tax=Novosphingobium lentum TaxID=145287 RepID=UPI00082BDCEF|nr:enoyl-CoA hydratase-related protein [Novosphingobium lentum]